MNEATENPVRRPELLTVLCILTFIGSGMSLLSNMLFFAAINPIKQALEKKSTFLFMGTELNFDFLLDLSPMFFLFQAILLSVSLLGAIQMWNLRKTGFHLYTFSQILLLIIPKLFISTLPFPFLEMLISSVFVYLYSRNLAYLK